MLEKAKPIDYVNGESSVERFRSWIINGGSIIDRDKYMINNELCTDYFIKYEDLEKGMEHVCNVLKIPFEPEKIPKLKIGIRDKTLKLSDYYNDKTIKIVSDTYSFELETFGYKPPV